MKSLNYKHSLKNYYINDNVILLSFNGDNFTESIWNPMDFKEKGEQFKELLTYD